ncbi:hypothetical protein ATANTOWER_011221 [Ataeniobius toweri]|uniref:Uncharacterized protein n=1 Tax=Ataeniobius toweri TaxID=208326 RepID=A0ABU7AFB6_9TELE|nr:hypothetical protein [Ataeniobius toweri]
MPLGEDGHAWKKKTSDIKEKFDFKDILGTASIPVGCLSTLIGPDGPSLCLSDLSSVTILLSVYIPP